MIKIFTVSLLLLNCTSFAYAQSSINSKNNELIVTYKGSADSIHFDIKGGEKLRLSKLNGDVWSTSKPINNIDQLILQYRFIIFHNNEEKVEDYQLWLGEKSKNLFKKKEKLNGSLFDYSFESNALKEQRSLSIYLPPNFDKSVDYPVIYMADGQDAKKYAYYLEELIEKKMIPNLLLIGVHNGNTSDSIISNISEDKRTLEYLINIHKYLPDADSARFSNHMVFFAEEVTSYVENNLLKNGSSNSTIYGSSSGASFVISTTQLYPTLFDNAIAYSVAWTPAFENYSFAKQFPTYYLASGTLEVGFHNNTKSWLALLKENNQDVFFKETVSYHDDVMWREYFLDTIIEIFND